MVMSHTQELVFLCMLNFFILVQSSADGPEHCDQYQLQIIVNAGGSKWQFLSHNNMNDYI